jgi:hypothetical protein
MPVNHGTASAVSPEADGNHGDEQGGDDRIQKADMYVVNSKMLTADTRSELKTYTQQREADGSHEKEQVADESHD